MKSEKLERYCDVISGYAFKSADWRDAGIPVVKIGNISNGADILTDEQTQYVDEELINLISDKYLINKGDVLISLTGSHINQPNSMVGRCCRNWQQRQYLLNQRAGKVIPYDPLDKAYLYYLFSTKEIKYAIANRAYGGANQVNVSPRDIKNIRWSFPTSEIRQSIASILSAYDDLIENNNRRIKILEQMAENLYKEWFVRFRFPGHEQAAFENGIPKGWHKCKLRDFAVEGGKGVSADEAKNLEHYLPIDCIPNKKMVLSEEDNVINAESSLHCFCKNDILFGAMRPYFHKVIMAPFSGVTRKTCFVIRAKNMAYNLFLYLTLFQKSSIDFATTISVGSTMPYVRWSDFGRLDIVIPSAHINDAFYNIVSPILQRAMIFYNLNKNLTKQRDMLLPRLMSGKLEV